DRSHVRVARDRVDGYDFGLKEPGKHDERRMAGPKRLVTRRSPRHGCPMKSLGEAATDLLWLSPCANSLVALARSPMSSVWSQVRTDPGLALLAARAWGDAPISFHPASSDVKLLRVSLHYLRPHASPPF